MNKVSGFVFVLVISLLSLITGQAFADPLDNWHWKNPIPQGNALRGVTFGSSKFVAVGDYGTVITSTDGGVNWNNRTGLNLGSAGTRESLRAITFGNLSGSVGAARPGFIAVGDSGTILKSTDGNSWTLNSTSGVTANLHAVAYGVEKITLKQSFVAVGANGTVIRTNEGTAWSSASDATAMAGEMLNGVAYGINTFVAVSNNGNIFYSSDNGDTWSKSPDSNSSRPLKGISFVNGSFMAVGYAGALVTSANGVSWTVQNSGTAGDLNAVTYGAINDTHVAVGSLSKIIGSTTGGVSWLSFPYPAQPTPSNYNLLAVTNDGNRTYIAVGEYGEILRHSTASGAAVWTNVYCCQITSLAFNMDPSNTGAGFNLYAGMWGAQSVSFTSDGGATWNTKNSGMGLQGVSSLALTPGASAATDRLYAGTGSGLFKSIDGGTTWGVVIPPLNVKVTAGDAQNSLQWSAVTGATSYNIYRSTSAGVQGNLLATTGVTSRIDTGLSNGTRYYYSVSTNIAGQESATGSQVSAAPQAIAILVPDNVAVTAGAGSNTITWNPVPFASSYNISINGTKSAASSPYTHVASVSNGSHYNYSVTAVNIVRSLTPTLSGSVTWDPVPGAASYDIQINGGGWVTGVTSPYVFNGNISNAAVRAINIQTTATASATVTESQISWNTVPGATSYNVTINGGALVSVAGNSSTYPGVITSSTITVIGGASDGTAVVGAVVSVAKTDIAWTAVPLADSYSIAINGGAVVSPVASPYAYSGPVASYTVTALDNVRVIAYSALANTFTWAAPAGGADSYNITIDGTPTPGVTSPYVYANTVGTYSMTSVKNESASSSFVGATPLRTPIQLTPVNTVIVDPKTANTLYLGNNIGMFKSTDQGLTWAEILYDSVPTSFANVNAVTVDKNNPAIIYVGATATTGTGLFKTTSGGTAWVEHLNNVVSSPGTHFGVIKTITIDPLTTTTLYLGTSTGGYKSSDSGADWVVTNPGLGSFSVNYFAINPVNPNIIYMGSDLGVHVTYNSGTDWSTFSNGLTSAQVRAIAIDPGKPEQLYAGTFTGGVFKLTDVFNINWNSHRNDIVYDSISKSSRELYGIGFGAENFVAVGSANSIALLGNASLPVVTGEFRSVVYGENGFLAVGAKNSDGVVYGSDTVGAAWKEIKSASGGPLIANGLYAITYGNGAAVAAGLSGALVTITGNSYKTPVSGVTAHLRAVAFGGGVFVAAGDGGTIITSTDAAIWNIRSSGITTAIYALSYGDGKFVGVGTGGTIITSADNGASWQSVAAPTTGNLYGVAYGNGIFVAVGEDAVHGTVFTSSDSGATWSARPSGSEQALYAVAFGKGQFYASGRLGTVLMSDSVPSAAATVTAVSPASGATGVPVNAPIIAIFSANMNGGTITNDGSGNGSFKISKGATLVSGASVLPYDAANFRATLSHGVLAYSTDYTVTLTTAVTDAAGNSLPAEYKWSFTTGPAPDTIPPAVIASSPGDPGVAITDVDMNSVIKVTFSEAIDITTISSNTFKVTDSSNQNVAGIISYNVGDFTATFMPSSPLLAGKTYTATVTSGIKDLSGNVMSATYVWAFSSRAAKHDVQLTVGANGSVVSNPLTAASPVTSATAAAQSIVTVNDNASASFTITPATGYQVADVMLDGASVLGQLVGNVYTLANVTADHATGIAVTFTKVTYALTTAVVSGGGAITVSSTTPVYGSSPAVTITPAAGYSLASLTDNGIALDLTSPPIGLVKTVLANADGTYTWTYTLTAINKNHDVKATFAVDVQQPTIILSSRFPESGSSLALPTTVISVNFSEAIDPTTIVSPATTFFLKDADSNNIAGQVAYDGTKATFTPLMPLKNNVVYTAYVTRGGKDLAGNVLAQDYYWSFTTTVAKKITVSVGANGTVQATPTISANKISLNDGDTATFTITPNSGYTLAEIALDGVPLASLPIPAANGASTYILPNVLADHTVDFKFAVAAVSYSLSAFSDPVIVGDSQKYLSDLQINGLSANNTGNGVLYWQLYDDLSAICSSCDPVPVLNLYKNSSLQPQDLVASSGRGSQVGIGSTTRLVLAAQNNSGLSGSVIFTNNAAGGSSGLIPEADKISFVNGSGGSVSPAGFFSVTGGSSFFFTIIPSEGYNLYDLKLDSFSVFSQQGRNNDVFSMAIDPAQPSTVYKGTGSGLYKSVDNGASWSLTVNGLRDTTINALAVDPTNPQILYAGTETGIYRSIDGAATWQSINPFVGSIPVYAIAIDRLTPAIIYIGTPGGLFKSADSGISWNTGFAGLGTPFVKSLAIDPSDSGTLYAGTALGVFKSTDFASSWSGINNGLTDRNINAFAIDPLNRLNVYVATNSGVFRSQNGGSSWATASIGLPITGIVSTLVVKPDLATTLYAGTMSGVYRSTDSGGAWNAVNTGLSSEKSTVVKALVINPALPLNIYAGTTDGAFRSSDGGQNWFTLPKSFSYVFTNINKDHILQPYFKMDTTSPSVISISPYKNSLNIDPATKVSVTFSEAMSVATITANTFFLKDGLNNTVPATISFDTSGTIATLTPVGALNPNTTYTVFVTTGVTDLAGNPMARQYSWSFTTQQLRTITVYTGPNGSFTSSPADVNGIVTFDPLAVSEVPFRIKPNSGYSLTRLILDGVEQTLPGAAADGSYLYTLTETTRDHSISFSFGAGTTVYSIYSQYASTVTSTPVVEGDDLGQISSISLSGLTGANTDNGVLYWSHNWGNDTFYLYKSSTKSFASQVARAFIGTSSNVHTTTLISDNASGITGTVTMVSLSSDSGSSNRITFSTTGVEGKGGIVMPLGLFPVASGDSFTFTIVPDLGYNLENLLLDSSPVFAVPSNSNNVAAIAIDPSNPKNVYKATGSGLYKSVDSGSSWTLAINGLKAPTPKINAVVVDPKASDTLYVGTQTGIYISSDGAANWRLINPFAGDVPVNAIVIDRNSTTTVYIGTPGGVYKSINSGGSWVRLSSGLGTPFVKSMTIDPADSNIIYVGTTVGIFRTINAGTAWSALNTGLTDLNVNKIVVDPAVNTRLYTATASGVFKSADGGASWTAASIGLPGTGVVTDLVIDPLTPTTLYAATMAGVFVTQDAGFSWSAANNGLSSQKSTVATTLAINKTPLVIYAGTTNGAFMTVDAGANWNALSTTFTYLFTNVNANHVFSASFSKDATPPSVIDISPYRNIQNVDPGTKISVSFSEAMDIDVYDTTKAPPVLLRQGTIDASSFFLRDGLNNSVPAKISFNAAGTIATLTPLGALNPNTTYTSVVTTGVKDLKGNALPNQFTWAFTTQQLRTVTVYTGPNGSFTSTPADVSGVITYDPLAITTVSFRIIPRSGYNLSQLTLDGLNQPLPVAATDGSYLYTLTNTTADHTLGLSFAVAAPVYTVGSYYKAVIYGDTSNQISALSLSGLSVINSANGVVFWDLNSSGGLTLYNNQLRRSQDRVATATLPRFDSANPTTTATTVISALNSSGLTGSVDSLFQGKSDTDPNNEISFLVANGGTVMPTGFFPVAVGGSFAFTIAPDPGYSLNDLNLDSIAVFSRPARSSDVSAIVVAPSEPTTVFKATGSGLYKSTDSGNSWVLVINGLNDTTINAVAVDPTNAQIVYAATQTGIFRSSNGGGLWTLVNPFAGNVPVLTIAIDKTKPATIYIGTPGGVFKTSNSGALWTKSATGIGDARTKVLTIDPKNPDIIYAGTISGIYKSTDAGKTWIAFNSGLQDLYVNAITIDPVTNLKVYVATNNGVFKTTDGGANWLAAATGLPGTGIVSALVVDPSNPAVLYSGTLSGIFKSSDSAATWGSKNTGLSSQNNTATRALDIDPLTPAIIFAGTTDGAYKSVDSATVWTHLSNAFSYTFTNINANHVLIASFSKDTTPPIVTTTTPGKNASEVDPSSTVSITFSEAMLQSSINADTFFIKDGVNNSIPATITFNSSGTTATLTPSAPLNAGSTYTVVVSSGVTDLAQNTMDDQYTWSFTTRQLNTITVSVGPNGGFTSNPPAVNGVITVNNYASASITIVPKQGYVLDSITLDGKSVMADLTDELLYTTPSITQNSFIVINFKKAFLLTVAAGQNGAVTSYAKGGDALGQLSKVSLSGLTRLNSNNGRLYWALQSVGPVRALSIYQYALDILYPKKAPVATGNCTDNGTGVCAITLTATGNSGLNGSVDIKYSSDNIATATNTLDAVVVTAANSPQTITVDSGSDRYQTITPNLGYSIASITDNGASPAMPLPTEYTLSSVKSDHAIAVTFSIDNVRPTVVSSFPADGAINVLPNVTIIANFSEALNPTSIISPAMQFVLKDSNNNNIAGNVTYSGRSAVFTPASLLEPGTIYQAYVTNGVQDLVGNSLYPEKTWKFTTGVSRIITVNVGSNGTATALPVISQGKVTVSDGDSAKFSITPIAGYYLSAILLDGVPVASLPAPAANGTTTYDLSYVNADHLLAFVFAPSPLSYTVSTYYQQVLLGDTAKQINELGIFGISSTNTDIGVMHWDLANTCTSCSTPIITMTLYKNSLKRDQDIVASGSIGAFNGTITLTPVNSSGLSARAYVTFTKDDADSTNKISVMARNGGTVMPLGFFPVPAGGSFSFTIIPDQGYNLYDLKLDSVSVFSQPARSADVLSVVVDSTTPTTVYKATGSGLYKSTDSGASWALAIDGLNDTTINALAVHPTISSILYAATQTGIYKSINGALSWTLVNPFAGNVPVNAIAIDKTAPATVYIGTPGGIFTSTDSGASWNKTSSGLGNPFVNVLVVDPTTPATMYAGTMAGVYKSINSGGSWSSLNNGLGDPNVNAIVIDSINRNNVYVATNSGVFKSSNGGNTWASSAYGLPGTGIVSALVINPDTPSVLFAGTLSGIFTSTDSAATWSATNTGLSSQNSTATKSLAINPKSSNILYAGSTDGAYKSVDGGMSWTALSKAFNYNFTNVNANHVLVASFNQDTTPPIVISTSPGKSAQNVDPATAITVNFSEALRPDTINASTFLLKDAQNNGIPATITMNAAGTAATLTPLAPLNAGVTYTGVITSGVSDLVQNTMTVQYAWSFTTRQLHSVTIATSSNGSFTSNPPAVNGAITVTNISTATISISPNPGYILDDITLDGISVKSQLVKMTYTTPAITVDRLVYITFKQAYLVTVAAGQNGSVTSYIKGGDSGGQLSNLQLTGITTLNSSNGRLNWKLVSSGNQRTLSLYKDSAGLSPVAEGSIIGNGPITLSAVNNSGLSGSMIVAYTSNDTDVANNTLDVIMIDSANSPQLITAASGSERYFSVTPNLGFNVASMKLDNVALPISVPTSYVLANISGDHFFEVGYANDVVRPLILSTTPVKALSPVGNVGLNAVIAVNFSEMIKANSVTAGTFLVKDSRGNAVPGTINPQTDAMNFIFTPTANYLFNETYSVTLTGGITDLAGNILDTGNGLNTFGFTTINSIALTTSVTGGSGTLTPSSANPNFNTNPTVFITPAAGFSLAALNDNGTAISLITPPASLVRAGLANADGTYNWTYTITGITAAHAISAVFSQDVNSPTVIGTIPAAAAVGVDPATTVSVAFSEAINLATIDELAQTGFILQNQSDGNNNIPWTVKKSVMGAEFIPSVPLLVGKTYRAIMTTAVKDLAGNSLASAISWSFSIRDATHVVTLNPVTNATVTWSPASLAAVPDNSNVIFTVTPKASGAHPWYQLDKILIDGTAVAYQAYSDGTYICTLPNVIKNQSVNITLKKTPRIVTVSPHFNGAVTSVPALVAGSVTVSDNDAVVLTFTPDTGSTLASLTDNGTSLSLTLPYSPGLVKGANNSWTYTTTVNSNRTVTPSFTNSLTVQATAGSGGLITPTANVVSYGGSQTFTVTPDAGYKLNELKVNGVVKTVNSSNQFTESNITANLTASATFTPYLYKVTVKQPENGFINPNGTVYLDSGATSSFKITASPGYKLVTVVDPNGAGTLVDHGDGTYDYTSKPVTSSFTLSATLALKTYTVTMSAGSNGAVSANGVTVNPSTSQVVTVSHGGAITFTAVPNATFALYDIKLDGVSVQPDQLNSYTLTADRVSKNYSIVMSFEPLYVVTASAGTNGTINPQGSTNLTLSNNKKTYTFQPSAGYSVDKVTVDGVDKPRPVPETNSYTLVATNPGHAIHVTFALIPVTGICGTAAQATFATMPTSNLCAAGSSSSVSGTGPWSWTCSGGNGGANASCSASIKTYAVTFVSGGNGTLTGTTSQVLNHGSLSTAVTAVPAAGYQFLNWTGTGGFATVSTNPLTVYNASSVQTITANFTANPVNGVCGAADGSTVSSAPATGLCSFGAASTVTGTGPWAWTCSGLNGGTAANCAAIPFKSGVVVPALGKTAPGIDDALRILKIAAGKITATQADKDQGDIAPLVNGKPKGDGIIDTYDVIGLLRMVVGLL